MTLRSKRLNSFPGSAGSAKERTVLAAPPHNRSRAAASSPSVFFFAERTYVGKPLLKLGKSGLKYSFFDCNAPGRKLHARFDIAVDLAAGSILRAL